MFLFEVKAHMKTTLIWCFTLCGWTVLLFSLYPSLSGNAAQMERLLEGYPDAVKNIIGLSTNSFRDFLSYFSFAFKGVIELGTIQAMILGTMIISKEVRAKTADFLFSKPIERGMILSNKILAACTLLIITNLIFLIVAGFMASIVATVDFKIFTMISISLLFVQIIFLAFGILLATLFPKIKSIVGISVGVLFIFMIASDVLQSMVSSNTLRYLIPFEYFGTENIIKNTSYEAPFVITAILITAFCLAASFVLYTKKDVSTI